MDMLHVYTIFLQWEVMLKQIVVFPESKYMFLSKWRLLLREINTLGTVSFIFTKGDEFVTSCLLSRKTNPFRKGPNGSLKGKNFLYKLISGVQHPYCMQIFSLTSGWQH